MYYYYPHYTDKDRSTEKFINLSKDTQLASDRTSVLPQMLRLLKSTLISIVSLERWFRGLTSTPPTRADRSDLGAEAKGQT